MRRLAAAALTVSVVGLLTQAAPGLRAAETEFHVLAGAAPDPDKAYEYTRYYPEQLRVHRGQTVLWTFEGYSPQTGFHTVTFAPGGESERPPIVRTDEWGFALDELWTFGTGCGHPYDPEPVCDLDSQTVGTYISSGAPLPGGGGPFRVRIGEDLPEGSYTYFCTVHPSMAGSLEVVDDSQPAGVPTPGGVLEAKEAIEEWVADEIARDTEAADAVVAARETPLPPEPTEDGNLLWTVWVGDSTADDHVAIDQYMPSHLDVEPGDRVRFLFPDGIVDEVHTVTFPAPLVDGAGTGIPPITVLNHRPMCDFDDPAGGLPGIPGPWAPFFFLPCPGHFEVGAEGVMPILALDNAVLSGATVHHSGWLVPQDAPETHRGRPQGSGEYFGSSAEAYFPVPGTFSYACEIHLTPMSGSIQVG